LEKFWENFFPIFKILKKLKIDFNFMGPYRNPNPNEEQLYQKTGQAWRWELKWIKLKF
jgi:hypothetical protein